MEKKKEKILKKGYHNESIQSCEDPYDIIRKALQNQENEKNEDKEDIEKCLRSGDKLFTH